MQLYYLLVVIVSDVKVMSFTVAVIRSHSIILASCKPGFRLAWACRNHVASRSKASRKPAANLLKTVTTARVWHVEIDATGSRPGFRQKSPKSVQSMSQTHTNLSKTCLQLYNEMWPLSIDYCWTCEQQLRRTTVQFIAQTAAHQWIFVYHSLHHGRIRRREEDITEFNCTQR